MSLGRETEAGGSGGAGSATSTADFGDYRDLGRATARESGALGHPREREQEPTRLGNEFMGQGKGINLLTKTNKVMFGVGEELRLTAIIHNRADDFEEDPKREKKLYKYSTKNKAQWREVFTQMTKVYHQELRRQQGGSGQRFDWASKLLPGPAAEERPGLAQTTLVETRLTHDFFLYSEINRFVEECFKIGLEKEVLTYIYDEQWVSLIEAERECFFSTNLVILRQNMLNKEFVDKRCVVADGMWKAAMIRPLSGGGGDKSGGEKSAKGGKGGARKDGGNKGDDRFGIARALKPYRSHETDINGDPYRNKKGELYKGSVCDKCEEAGLNFFHHPLRCDVSYPDWRQSPPEERGVNQWYTRGGGTASLA